MREGWLRKQHGHAHAFRVCLAVTAAAAAAVVGADASGAPTQRIVVRGYLNSIGGPLQKDLALSGEKGLRHGGPTRTGEDLPLHLLSCAPCYRPNPESAAGQQSSGWELTQQSPPYRTTPLAYLNSCGSRESTWLQLSCGAKHLCQGGTRPRKPDPQARQAARLLVHQRFLPKIN